MSNNLVSELVLASSSYGRERWCFPGLYKNEELGIELESYLSDKPGITDVKANPLTGRVLILFSPNKLREKIHALLYQSNLLVESDNVDAQESKPLTGIKNTILSLFTGVEDNSLLKLIRSEKGDELSMAKPAMLSTANTLLKMLGPINLGLIVVAGVSGGLPLAGIPILSRISILSSPIGQIAALTATYFSLSSLQSVVEYKRKNAWELYSNEIANNLRNHSLEHVHQMDMAELDNFSNSQLSSYIRYDADAITKFVSEVPHSVIERSLTFTIGTTVLFLVAPTAFVISILPLPILYYITKDKRRKVSEVYENKSANDTRLVAIVSDNLQGLSTIRSFAAEDREIERLRQASEAQQQANQEAVETSNWLTGVTQFSLSSGTAAAMIYGSAAVLNGSLTFPALSVLSSLLPPMIMSTQGINREVELYQNAFSSAQRILETRKIKPKIYSNPDCREISDINGSLVFKDVGFSYDDDNPFIQSFNLEIEPGKMTAFVGGTGSGKSTLVKLLSRFYDPQYGQVIVDGDDIRNLDLRSFREHISVISQDSFLFQSNIMENIRYGRPDATDEEVVIAAQCAQAYDFIMDMPEGFDTLVNENGKNLSGGQRQRLSIARAVLKDAPVLILDEATSSVDNKTEDNLRHSLAEITKGKTTIVIAHRLSTIRNADKIVLINEGKISEAGSHEDLVMQKGQYAELWNLQTQSQATVNPT